MVCVVADAPSGCRRMPRARPCPVRTVGVTVAWASRSCPGVGVACATCRLIGAASRWRVVEGLPSPVVSVYETSVPFPAEESSSGAVVRGSTTPSSARRGIMRSTGLPTARASLRENGEVIPMRTMRGNAAADMATVAGTAPGGHERRRSFERPPDNYGGYPPASFWISSISTSLETFPCEGTWKSLDFGIVTTRERERPAGRASAVIAMSGCGPSRLHGGACACS